MKRSCKEGERVVQARRIVLMAFGENKSGIVAQAVEGPVSSAVPVSFLQRHPNATLFLDASAAAGPTPPSLPASLLLFLPGFSVFFSLFLSVARSSPCLSLFSPCITLLMYVCNALWI